MAKYLNRNREVLHRTGQRIVDWNKVNLDEAPPLTYHARQRTSSRGIAAEQVQKVIDHGREVHQRHAVIYFIGDREIARDKSLSDCDGIHVVCAPNGGAVLTVYRNKEFTQDRSFANQKPKRQCIGKRYGK
jgi:hypothetical protein